MPRTVILTASGLPCRLRKSTSSIVELAGCLIGYIMVGKTAPIRPEDAGRMERIHKYCGCLPCLICGVVGFAVGGVLGLLLMALLFYGRSGED